jgi:hypothetical protein
MSTENPFAKFMPPEPEKEEENPFAKFMPTETPEPEKKGFLNRVADAFSGGAGQRGDVEAMRPLKAAETVKEGVVGNAEFDIPAIQELPEFGGITDYAQSAFSTAESVDTAFLERNPQYQEQGRVKEDKAGNRYITNEDGSPRAYFEQPGIGLTDVAEAAVNVGVSVLPAAGVAAWGNRALQAGRLGRAVIAGGAEAATAYGLEKTDLDEGVNPWIVAAGAVMPAAAEGLGAIFKQVSGKQSREFIEFGKDYARKAGLPDNLQDESYKALGMRESGKLKHDVTDEAIMTIEEYNVPMTAGQASRDPAQLGREQALRDRGFSEISQADRAQAEALQRNVVDPQFEAARGGRSEAETGADLNRLIRAEERDVYKAAKADQTARDVAVEEAGLIDPKGLAPVQRNVQRVIDEMGIDSSRNVKAYPVTRKFLPRLTKDIDRLVAASEDVVIKPEIPYKRAVKEGNVQRQIDREMKFMKVKPEDATYMRMRMDDMRDATPEQLRNIKFQMKEKGYSAADINRAEANIRGVRRAQPAVPKTPAEIQEGQLARFKELDRIREDINGNLIEATGKDKVALIKVKKDFENYMLTDARRMFKDNPEALVALGKINTANKSWNLYADAFKAQKGDNMSKIVENIASGKMSNEKVIASIIGGEQIKLDANDLNTILKAAGKRQRGAKELILEGVERRVWGDAKRSLAEKSPDQAFNMLRQILHGNRKELGKVLYQGVKRQEAEKVLKMLDSLRRTTSTKQKLEVFNSAYARMNMGGVRTVLGVDQMLGYPWRKMMAKSAVKPLGTKKGEFAGKTYAQAAAIYEAGKGEE